MNVYEMALQLTLKAMETGFIVANRTNSDSVEVKNEFNRKQVSDFYKSMVETIENATDGEFSVQS